MDRGIKDPGTYLKQRHVQGVIHIAPQVDDVWISRIGASRIPQIVVGSRWNGDKVSYVHSDNIGGPHEAVDYLLT